MSHISHSRASAFINNRTFNFTREHYTPTRHSALLTQQPFAHKTTNPYLPYACSVAIKLQPPTTQLTLYAHQHALYIQHYPLHCLPQPSYQDCRQVFSLGVLTFTTHHRQLYAISFKYKWQKFGGASAPPSTHLSTALPMHITNTRHS